MYNIQHQNMYDEVSHELLILGFICIVLTLGIGVLSVAGMDILWHLE